MPDFLILGNTGSPRIDRFQAALARCGMAPAGLLAWEDWLDGRESLAARLGPHSVLRIESPGRNFTVERLIIARGDRGCGTDLPAAAARALAEDPGRIRHSAQWLRGWVSACGEIEATLAAEPRLRSMNAPGDLAAMFDKSACHALCRGAGVNVPPSPGPVQSYDDLRDAMARSGMPRVFVKPKAGSSGSGVLAYETAADGREQVTAALEVLEREGELALYNNRRVRRFTEHRIIRAVIDRLAREGVHVERWVPKPHVDGHVWDLRVLVIAGRARHRIARLSRTPLTNLHLLNRRESIEHLALPPETIAAIETAAERAAAVFPNSLHVGVDILVPRRGPPLVLEVNAFGDLLPGLLHEGEDTYEAEINALCCTV